MAAGWPAEDDPVWKSLKGGYRCIFNPLPLLRKLCDKPADGKVWAKVWSELHHQGDVDSASYAIAARLIELRATGVRFDWNFYGFMCAVELERHNGRNPPLPEWLTPLYEAAWGKVTAFCSADMAAAEDSDQMRVYLSVLALARGHSDLAYLLLNVEQSQIAGFRNGELGWG